MYSRAVFLAINVLVAGAAKFSNSNFNSISTGSPFAITWVDASGPVTLKLKNGPSTALKDASTIGSGLIGSSFSWTPAGSFPEGPYAFEIIDSTGPNYSVQFEISDSSDFTDVSTGATASSTLSSSPASSGLFVLSSTVLTTSFPVSAIPTPATLTTSYPPSTLASGVPSDPTSSATSAPSPHKNPTISSAQSTSVTSTSTLINTSSTTSATKSAALGRNNAAHAFPFLTLVLGVVTCLIYSS
ncbi:uncharacterized protein BP5553_09128 [Venustampulla echinocandica]|uniref:Yeast cell wall synthesis Kre9/Knh1-like N-terminal domain-containing protein n=1 Tax=Venustampulla echinocandica TaxID=2656787 RepID=A0A370TE05_9HELO|nr:uncharacterized protein BP5553_09128 [Venustampulla echinocandica]RDL32672.1 hypothetical protein BP5553_09128 [Venustampulla echinocandica]